MPELDFCIAGTYEPGNIPASSGQVPVQSVITGELSGTGTAALTFTVSGDLSVPGSAALSGTSGMTFTPTADLVALSFASLDGTATNVTLSNGNLTATHANTTDNSGARSTAQQSSGKWYFEVTLTDVDGNADCVAVITAPATYTNLITNGTNCAAVYRSTGNIFSNNANSGRTLGALADGDIIGVAVDLDNEKVWFRKAPSGNWNGQVIGSQNPATNTGGVSISSYAATTMAPAVGFGGPSTQAGDVMTANFGATAFTGTVPSGFTSGWGI